MSNTNSINTSQLDLDQYDQDENLGELIPPDIAKIWPGYENKKCKHDRDCRSVGSKCARPGISLPKGNPDHAVCCVPGTDTYPVGVHKYCRDVPEGFFCQDATGCKNGACGHPEGKDDAHKICCPNGERYYHYGKSRFFCKGAKPGTPCFSDQGCASDNCVGGVCSNKTKRSLWDDVKYILLAILATVVLIAIIYAVAKK